MTELESSFNTTTSTNNGNNYGNALQIRLETQGLIENIELFLRGSIVKVLQDEKTGRIYTKRLPIGKPKANDSGIQAILNYVSSIINPQVVQGNFPSTDKGMSEMYESYVFEVNTELAKSLVLNCYNWEIREEDIDVIIDFIMKLVIPFMTRLIDNEERKSYESTIQHIERNTVEKEAQKKFNLFGNSQN